MLNKEYYSLSEVADMLSVSKETLRRWDRNGKLKSIRNPLNDYRKYHRSQLEQFEEAKLMFNTLWDEELKVESLRDYSAIELFAGAGGLSLGLEKAGFKVELLNELSKDACNTLNLNRPDWELCRGDISEFCFKDFKNEIDLVSGGFPCQAFSYAGKKLGFEDTRGSLFYEFARVIKEVNPKVLLAENVRGLLRHDEGKTLEVIKGVISELGYTLVEPRVLKAIFYKVPQKRERLFLIAIKNNLAKKFNFYWPSPYNRIMTVKDALKKGELYDTDVKPSEGQLYPKRKKEILAQVPQGGYWRDLPDNLQREYMQKSYFLGGGKTGMARRLSWDEPSLTLTTSPAQKQTERCHPKETRPLQVREYARIQTFPDNWFFEGSVSSQYRQIGNAVPVNLAYAVGRSLIRLLNDIESNSFAEVSLATLQDKKRSQLGQISMNF